MKKILSMVAAIAMLSGVVQFQALAAEQYLVTTASGITASVAEAVEGESVTVSGDYAKGSVFVNYGDENTRVDTVLNSDGTCSFVMPAGNVNVTGLANSDTTIYVVPSKFERVLNAEATDKRNYFIGVDKALGVTYNIPYVEGKMVSSATINFVRQKTTSRYATNIYNQSSLDAFEYVNSVEDNGYIMQYDGNSVVNQPIDVAPEMENNLKLLFAYDSGVSATASGNDYYVINPSGGPTDTNAQKVPTAVENLPYLTLTLTDAPKSDKQQVWNTFLDKFTGKHNDYSMVWNKFATDSAGASHTLENNVLQIISDEAVTDPSNESVCYGVSVLIKNILPNTEYTISFKEKTSLTTFEKNGFYMNADTLATTATSTSSNVTKAVDTRNQKTYIMHDSVSEDSDWETRAFKWNSGSGMPENYDTYVGKFTFILRGSCGVAQIKDIVITGPGTSIGANVADGAITDVVVSRFNELSACRAFVAQYDGHGKLISVDDVEGISQSGAYPISVQITGELTKVMLLSDAYKPVCEGYIVK